MSPFWGEELTAETTPLEVNRSFKVSLEKDFIGKDALVEQKLKGVTKRLVHLYLHNFDHDVENWPWGGEAIFRNGEYVGFATNSAYGFALEKTVVLGFISHPETIKGAETIVENSWILDRRAKWTINIGGKLMPATIHLKPPKLPEINQDEKEYKPKRKPGHAPHIQLLEKSNS